MIVDMMNSEAMMNVRVAYGTVVGELREVSKSYKGSHDGYGCRKDLLCGKECNLLCEAGYRPFDLSAAR